MDPITILGAVAASAQLAGTTAQFSFQLYRFYCDVKKAPTKSKELCNEVSELATVMESLARTIKIVEESSDNVIIDVISDDSLQKYAQFLNELSSRILVNKNDIKKKLKWPLSTKDNETLIAKIERQKSTFNLALQAANLKLDSTHTYFSW